MSRENNTRIRNMNEFVNADKASVDIYEDKVAVTTQVFPDDAEHLTDSKARSSGPKRSAAAENGINTEATQNLSYALQKKQPENKKKSKKASKDQGNVAVRGKVLASRSQPVKQTSGSSKKYSDIVNERNARTNPKKKKRYIFLKFIIIYSVVLLAFVAAGCVLFAMYLNNYENTRPATFAAEVVEKHADSDTLTAFLTKNSSLIDGFDSTEDIISNYVLYTCGEGLSYTTAPESTDENPSYYITMDGQVMAQITLGEDDVDFFKLTNWKLTGLDILSFQPDLTTITILAPVGSTVLFNGEEISTEYLTDSGVPDFLECTENYLNEIPQFDTYTIETIASSIAITGTDTEGTEVEYSSSGLMYVADGTLSDEFILTVSARAEVVLTEFAKYFAGASNSLSSYVLWGCELYTDLFGTTDTDPVYTTGFGSESAVSSYEFSEFEVSDYTYFTDTCITTSVEYTMSVYLEDDDTEYTSRLETTWVWIKASGSWYLCSTLDTPAQS